MQDVPGQHRGERCASGTEQNSRLVRTKLVSAFCGALVTCGAGLVNGCRLPEPDPWAKRTCSQVWESSRGKSHHLTVCRIRFISVGTGGMPQYFFPSLCFVEQGRKT